MQDGVNFDLGCMVTIKVVSYICLTVLLTTTTGNICMITQQLSLGFCGCLLPTLPCAITPKGRVGWVKDNICYKINVQHMLHLAH